MGGTFDRLHAGHKAFLTFALTTAENLIIGITSDQYVKKHKQTEKILPFSKRREELRAYLEKENASDRVRILKIDENTIPGEHQSEIDAIIATTDTLNGAEILNKKRVQDGFSSLPIALFTLRNRESGKAISSTDIRKGEIDRKGDLYLADEMRYNTYKLPVNLRKHLKEPLGKIITSLPKHLLSDRIIVTVGDVTTKTFVDTKLYPIISVVDLVIERKKTYRSVDEIGFLGDEQLYQLENKKSSISPGVFMMLSHLFYHSDQKRDRSIIQILGEEDLIVLPVILLAPLGTYVYYGQPGVGMVEVLVDEEIKQKMRELLAKFTKISLEHSH